MSDMKTIRYSFERYNGRLSCFTHNGNCDFEDGQQIIMQYLRNEEKNGSKITVKRWKKGDYYTYDYEVEKTLDDNKIVKKQFLINVEESIKSHPAFMHFNLFLESFYLKVKRREIEEQNRIKRLKFGTAVGTIALGIVLVIATPKVVQNISKNIDEQIYNKTVVGLLDRDLQIHAGVYSSDGVMVSPYLDHDCVLGKKEYGSVESRIRAYCAKNNIDKRIEEAAVKKYQLLYDNKNEGFEIDLKALLEEIEKEALNQEGNLGNETEMIGSKRI